MMVRVHTLACCKARPTNNDNKAATAKSVAVDFDACNAYGRMLNTAAVATIEHVPNADPAFLVMPSGYKHLPRLPAIPNRFGI